MLHDDGTDVAAVLAAAHEYAAVAQGAPAIDLAEAERFLDVLAEGEPVTFQTFDDDADRKQKSLARILHGTLEEHAAELTRLNQRGAGVFVMVNFGDGKGREGANVTGVRGVFVDLDGAPPEPILKFELTPHIVVESSPRKYHAYWLLADCALEQFRPLQKALIAKFNGDPSVHDLPRVMRLPGFIHRKGAPYRSRVIQIEPLLRPYPVADLLARVNLAPPKPQAPTGGSITEGGRNVRLTSIAGSLRRYGMAPETIATALLAVNAECTPPLPEGEVRSIATSVGRYDPLAKGANLVDLGFWVRDARITVNIEYVLKGVIYRGQVVVFWGPPGAGKSFNAAELLCCVGSGSRWRGRRTTRGVVIYVCAESTRTWIENRFAALARENPDLADADVLIVPLALDLLHEAQGDVDRVIDAAKALAEKRGQVTLICIDTLAVTFGGGDENGPDMGRYVTNVKRIVTETGAAVLVIHHSGKDEARGMRGHTALLGALDAELAIEGTNEERILRTGKVRDGEAYTDLFAFTLRPVDLGKDADGDVIRTCVVDSLDENGTKRVRQRRKGAALGKNQKAVLQAVEAAGGRIPRTNLAHKLKADGMARNRVQESIAALLENGMLIPHNDVDPPEVSLP